MRINQIFYRNKIHLWNRIEANTWQVYGQLNCSCNRIQKLLYFHVWSLTEWIPQFLITISSADSQPIYSLYFNQMYLQSQEIFLSHSIIFTVYGKCKALIKLYDFLYHDLWKQDLLMPTHSLFLLINRHSAAIHYSKLKLIHY